MVILISVVAAIFVAANLATVCVLRAGKQEDRVNGITQSYEDEEQVEYLRQHAARRRQ